MWISNINMYKVCQNVPALVDKCRILSMVHLIQFIRHKATNVAGP